MISVDFSTIKIVTIVSLSYAVTQTKRELFKMKYQQLENLECGWKWTYLISKWRNGEAITRHVDTSEAEVAVNELGHLEHEPTKVLEWIEHHMSPELDNKLKQAIRAKRKRQFNAEQIHTKKKSIDLEY